MSKTTVCRLEWHGEDKLELIRRNLETGGAVQMAIDNAVIRYSHPYCPFETGTLADSPYRASPPGQGEVIYETPYARRLYYGEDFNFNQDTNPLAGAYWVERMKANHLQDIVEEAKSVLDK